jgi:hypothetical protein
MFVDGKDPGGSKRKASRAKKSVSHFSSMFILTFVNISALGIDGQGQIREGSWGRQRLHEQ